MRASATAAIIVASLLLLSLPSPSRALTAYDCTKAYSFRNATLESDLSSLATDDPKVAGLSHAKSDATTILSSLFSDGVFYGSALSGTNRRNHVYILAKDRIHYTVCRAVDVTRLHAKECYEDEPIRKEDGSTAFRDTATGFLKTASRQIDCVNAFKKKNDGSATGKNL